MGVAALVVSGLTLAATWLLKGAQTQAAIDLQREQREVAAFDLFNPATWGNIQQTVVSVPEAAAAFIRFQLLSALIFIVAVGGTLVTAFIIWRDYFGGPTVRELAAGAAAVTPAARIPRVGVTVGSSPVEGNPEFKRGSRARAVRDLLAKRIRAAGGAREPFAVATEVVKREGERGVDIPEAEIKAEQRRSARG